MANLPELGMEKAVSELFARWLQHTPFLDTSWPDSKMWLGFCSAHWAVDTTVRPFYIPSSAKWQRGDRLKKTTFNLSSPSSRMSVSVRTQPTSTDFGLISRSLMTDKWCTKHWRINRAWPRDFISSGVNSSVTGLRPWERGNPEMCQMLQALGVFQDLV